MGGLQEDYKIFLIDDGVDHSVAEIFQITAKAFQMPLLVFF